MSGREFWIDFIRTYFMIVTLITLAMCIVGKAMMPEQTFGYEAFAAPLLNGLVGTIPNLVLYSKRELKVKELLVRKILQLILIEIGILCIALYGSKGSWLDPLIVGVLAGCVFAVYAAGTLISWLVDLASAKAMDHALAEFQRMNAGGDQSQLTHVPTQITFR